MTKIQFDLFATALLKSIWQGSEEAPHCLGVSVEKIYKDTISNGQKVKEAISQIHYELLDDVSINLDANEIPSPFSFVNNVSELKINSHHLSISDPKYLFPKSEGDIGFKHEELIAQLRERFEGFPKGNESLENYFRVGEMLLSLLQYFTSSIEVGKCGASLYDLARLSAAVLCCKVADQFKYPTCLFVKADFSGIQDFIFDVGSKGAAKSLKSRSLRIQLLTILATDYLLQELNITPANLIYIGGGNFYLLVPQSQEQLLKELIQKIRNGLIQIPDDLVSDEYTNHTKLPHLETLNLFIGYTSVEFASLKQDFGNAWKEVDKSLNLQRIKPYSEDAFDLLFKEPLPHTSQTVRRRAEQNFYKQHTKKINYYKGYELSNSENWVATERIKFESEVKLRHGVEIQHPFSSWNRKFKLLAEDEERISRSSIKWQDQLGTHTMINDFQIEPQKNSIPKPYIFLVKDLPIWKDGLIHESALEEPFNNRMEMMDDAEKEDFHTFVGKQNNNKSRNIIEFTHLSMFASLRTGTDKLGVLKMDVDSLGKLFQERIKPEYDTLIHTAALSRALKWFFEGYMNKLLDTPIESALKGHYSNRDKEKLNSFITPLAANGKKIFSYSQTFRDNLYVIFSGGDDFFLVGAWDIALEFAQIVRRQFEIFTNNCLTLSAGFIVVGPKFPVSRFVKLVEEEGLEKAKKVDGKNSITLLDQTLRWEDFYMALNIRNSLYDLVKHKGESRALIHKVRKSMKGFERIQQEIKEKNHLPFPRIWRLAYYLRDVKKENKDQVEIEILGKYEDLLKRVLQRKTDVANPGLISVGARLAEFMTKTSK